MKSSFEDKLVPENLITETYKGWSKNTNANGNIYNIYKKYTSNKGIKPNTVYTVIVSKMSKYCNGQGLFQYISSDGTSKIISKQFINNKCFTINLTDITEPITSGITLYQKFNDITGNEVPTDGEFYIVEGDYTNYDFTNYDSTKAGKYKVDYKVTGKNLIAFTELGDILNKAGEDVSLIGNIDDKTNDTFYGAWNVVLQYLITNYPTTKIGIIGFWRGNQKYQYTDALRNIAKKYRIPFLDFMFDYNIPIIGGTDFRSYNPNASNEVVVDYNTLDLRQKTFLADTVHPNDTGYKYMSTIIENWLKSL